MKEKLQNHWKRLRYSYRAIPDKKVYLEFLTGLLSIPVLLTVILLNVSNLNNDKKETPEEKKPEQQIIYISPSSDAKNTETKPTPTDSPACKKGIGQISILSPDEGEIISDNPVNLLVEYTPGEYCAVVWSYRINSGSWSNYDDKSIALYNLPKGKVAIDLRVKSIVTGEEKSLQRIFTYNGISQTATDPTPIASPSAN